MFIICKICNKEFLTYPCRKNSKYCSQECYKKDWHNIHVSVWNKGTKGIMKAWNKGTKGIMKPNRTSFKKGQIAHNYQGGLTFFNREKRWFIVCRDGRTILFARAIVEANLKRHLKLEEVVHHINENINDDRIENLAVMSRKAHLAIHREKVLGARKWYSRQRNQK